MFASPVRIGRLPWSYDQVWRMYQKASAKAAIGALGTHTRYVTRIGRGLKQWEHPWLRSKS